MFELNVRFQLAALIFVTVILFDFLRSKKIPTMANKKFRMVIICTFICLLCDITTVYTITHMDTVAESVNIAAHRVFYISIASVVQSFYKYICALDSDKATENRLVSVLCNLPFAAAVASALFLNIYFVCDNEKYAYSQGAAVMAMFFFVGILLLIIISTTIRLRIPAENKVMILCGVTVWIIVCIIQYFFPNLLLTGLGIFLMLLLVYLAFENPVEYIDHQTGCYNSYAFDSVLFEKMHSEKAFDIITVVVDELGSVITRFGYAESHRLMREFADFLISVSGKNVYAYRDDCFALFSDSESNTERVCCAIKERLGGIWTIQGMVVSVCAHADVLRFPDYAHNGAEVSNIIKYADEHIEKGKLLNIIDKKCADGFKREAEIAVLLKKAVENEDFDVYYQPIYNVQKGKYTAAEAHIYLRDTGGLGAILPEEFIPVAEKNGLIAAIDGIVTKKVRGFMSGGVSGEPSCVDYVEINLPDMHTVMDSITSAFNESDSAAHSMTFKMAGSAVISHSGSVNIRRIESSAIAKELYAEIPRPDENKDGEPFIIKLDKGFIAPCLDGKNKRAEIALESIVGAVCRLGYYAAADGADSREMAEKLISCGVSFLQGHYYSDPLREDKFVEFMKNEKNNNQI